MDRKQVGHRRIVLWAHVVSEHCCVVSPEASYDQLVAYHEHEHDGPGTIRNHLRSSRTYSLQKLGKVLAEAD